MKISEFDGYIFVTPEYNHSTSGVLKNAIDYIHGEWNNAASTEYRPPPDQMNARQITDRKAGYSNPPRCDQNPAGNLVRRADPERGTHRSV